RATGLQPGAGTDTPMAVAIRQVTDQDEVAVVSEGDVVALGRIVPQGDIVTVATPFGAGDARISEIRVREGDVVQAGDVLAVLDSLRQLEAQLEAARADVAVAQATLSQTEASIRAGRDEARAGLERAIATERVAAEELDRTTSLMDRGVTTRAALDTAIARATEAARDVEKAGATLSRYDANGDGVQADIAVARANLQAARAGLTQSELDVEKAYVRASIDGTVLDIHVQPGERPDTDGVLDLGDTTRMTVEAEVYQTLIGRVVIGDPATITAPALRGALSGQVSAIGLEIGRQSITSDDPAANTDARVVDVIIALDAASSEQAKRLTNLQVVTRIDAGRGAE
ncbi:MAG: HlyD family efflux transporter periplasmic adaptor subunit, partial [Tateyamaria sp.]